MTIDEGTSDDLQENLIEETKEADPNDSFAELKQQNFTAIPQLRNNKNALNRTSMPFSARLFSGQIKIDHKDVHAVANQMLFEINLLAG